MVTTHADAVFVDTNILTRAQSYSQPIPMPDVLEQVNRFRAAFKIAEETTAVLEQMLTLAAALPLRGKQTPVMKASNTAALCAPLPVQGARRRGDQCEL